MEILIILGIIAIIIAISFVLKVPKSGNVVLVTGGVKVGKSTFAVRLVQKEYKRALNKWRLYNYCLRYFTKHKCKREKPLIYSNVPLAIPYAPLSSDLIHRRTRFAYGSIIYVCEASLLADSMSFKDEDLNECLSLLVKLIGHETKGGKIVLDTQSVLDLHYGMKRNLSSYFYIHSKIRLPFFLILKMREMVFLDNTSNDFNEDIEKSMLWCVVPTSTWRLFDCYCYSALTDHLPLEDEVIKTKDLKARKILTFKKNTKFYEVNNDKE